MINDPIEKRIEALEGLRSASESQSTTEALRKALNDRNNYLVSKAAAVVSDLRLRSLVPDLLAAFDRFLSNPIKTDPQCWAKNGIVKALKALEHTDPAVFLRGLKHFQLEPVWGGRSDTAAALRATCVLALVGCQLDDLTILGHMADALADPEKLVRIDAARAIGQLSRPEGTLLLRLKSLVGDLEPEVVGQCFSSLLSLAPSDGLLFVSRFLDGNPSEICIEAACAIGASSDKEAVFILKQYWERCTDFDLKRAILVSLGASPVLEAATFLLSVLRDSPEPIAAESILALSSSRYRSEMGRQAARIIAARSESGLRRLFEKEFGH